MNFNAIRMAASCAIFAGLGVTCLRAAPLTVTLTDEPVALASAILALDTTVVGTPVLSGNPGQAGLFTNFNSGLYAQTRGASGIYNLASGVILSTGIASGAEGNYVGGPSFDASGPGDAMLSTISGGPTFDAVGLTIQFTSASPTLSLNFVFASAEYPGFVATTPTDPIAIFLNGANVALVPGTSTPISVNSVNANSNSNYFTQYSTPGTPFNYGGATTLFSQTLNVSTSSVNAIRFAIADAGDGSLDSALLIQSGSTTPVPEPSAIFLSSAGTALVFGLVFFRRRVGARL